MEYQSRMSFKIILFKSFCLRLELGTERYPEVSSRNILEVYLVILISRLFLNIPNCSAYGSSNCSQAKLTNFFFLFIYLFIYLLSTFIQDVHFRNILV